MNNNIPSIEDIEPDLEQEQQNGEENINATYQFEEGYIDPDDNLEEFLEDFRKPKQETGAPEQPDDDELPVDMEEDSISAESARYSADLIVETFDSIAAYGLSFLSKNPVEEHQAGKEQKKHLKKLWTELCKEKGINLPIGTQILIAIIVTYGMQVPKALSDRKMNLQLQAIEEDRKRLDNDRKILEREREAFNIKRRQQLYAE